MIQPMKPLKGLSCHSSWTIRASSGWPGGSWLSSKTQQTLGDHLVQLKRYCSCVAACHAGGGNVVQGGKTLKTQDMERNGVNSPEAIYQLIYGGKGKMPGYGQNCAPKVGPATRQFAEQLCEESRAQ